MYHRCVALSLLLAIGGAAISGCADDHDIKTFSDIGPGVGFEGGGETFAWTRDAIARPRDPKTRAPHVHELFCRLVTEDLTAKGYHETNADSSAYLLDYSLDRRIVGNFDDPQNDRIFGRARLEIYDPATRRTIWRGSAEVKIDTSRSPPEIEERMRKIVKKMLAPVPAYAAHERATNVP